MFINAFLRPTRHSPSDFRKCYSISAIPLPTQNATFAIVSAAARKQPVRKRPVAAIGCLRDGAAMRGLFYAIALVSSAGCSQELASEQELVMRAIESAVQLPAGAKQLEEYSRNYASRPDGKVVGIYVVPRLAEERVGDIGCEVTLENFKSRPCTEAEKAEIADQEKATADLFGQANQTRWYDDYRELPMILDGGCVLIEVIFDPQSQVIQSARCNGEA